MPTTNNNPLPSLPAEGERVVDFLRRSTPEEIVGLALELDPDTDLFGDDIPSSYIWTELSTGLFDMPDLVIEVCERYIAQTPSVSHVQAAYTAADFLGRGHVRAEALIWDVLLAHPDDALF